VKVFIAAVLPAMPVAELTLQSDRGNRGSAERSAIVDGQGARIDRDAA
jgi:hypothetical protein